MMKSDSTRARFNFSAFVNNNHINLQVPASFSSHDVSYLFAYLLQCSLTVHVSQFFSDQHM